jgi:2-polyprenyl-6-methoxyphenol hydroxylase-like FAD-dependent oxidoreductase
LELDALVPGYLAALRAAGATFSDASTDTFVVEFGQEMPRRTTGTELVSAPRSLLETVLREQIQDRDAPTILTETSVRGILLAGDDSVRGVSTDCGDMFAPIVVDAMGLTSPLLGWLPRRVAVEIIPVRQWYVSADFIRPRHMIGDPTMWLVFPDDRTPRGGLVSPVSPDRWRVSLSGRAEESPPLTTAEMRTYAAGLSSPVIADILHRSDDLDRPRLFRKPTARWNHVEELDGFSGLFFVGDSIASLNPLLGQGISVMSWQARLLRDVMQQHVADVVTASEVHRASTVAPIEAALRLTRFDDETVPLAAGGHGTATDRLRELSVAAQSDDSIHDGLVGLWHLLIDPDEVLSVN